MMIISTLIFSLTTSGRTGVVGANGTSSACTPRSTALARTFLFTERKARWCAAMPFAVSTNSGKPIWEASCASFSTLMFSEARLAPLLFVFFFLDVGSAQAGLCRSCGGGGVAIDDDAEEDMLRYTYALATIWPRGCSS